MALDNFVFVFDGNGDRLFTGDLNKFKTGELKNISKRWLNYGDYNITRRNSSRRNKDTKEYRIADLMEHLKEQVRIKAIFLFPQMYRTKPICSLECL